MWAIRDSDGAETLHSIYPGWAVDVEHLTVIPLVTKASYDAVVKELELVQKQLNESQKWAKQHMRTMRDNQDRMREVEAANNKYYALIQRHGIYQESLVDDSPLIDVKV
jgi:Iap family predicted aminopeptidase